jgi:hypothetical protein
VAATPRAMSRSDITGLFAAEVERGWVEFACDVHGFLVATTPNATVWCSCGKRARHTRHGRLLDPDTLKPTQAKARELNTSGHPFIHGCGDCGEDFGGRTLQQRHRVGSKLHKRCMTPEEMQAKGWHCDAKGRWRKTNSLEDVYEKRPRTARSRATSEERQGEDSDELVAA